ncbi:MAG: epoxyqueuosine reductase QueH [Oscillospiraceae bacterium]
MGFLKTNYQLETDRLLTELGEERPGLLLHSCCGPCSTYVLEYLTKYFDVTVLFYGPNIQPESEYALRLEHQRKVLERTGVRLMDCPYDGAAFTAAVKGLEGEPEGGERCTVCFRLRLEETARRASEGGFPYYCTTLTVSPHKDAERINRLGREIGERWGVRWLPSDFKKRGGYQRSLELSRDYELYRQDYCGCLYSKNR